ncbi:MULTISPECIES: hypothetical protein [Halorussus]|uniref:hypothetical protein n=1 Tax=Halorussus TaxID=1070314 RepID=UPI000E2107D1|nr:MULTISPECIES: hypothetical protein [Halorussus]NHN61095.1 hypothetical protein [Halorussus sp. JP-T4]
MAILEINLEKPALVEEYQYPDRTPAGTQSADESTSSEGSTSADESASSGGGKGKLVGLLAVAAGVALLAWKLKSGGSEQTDFDEFESDEEYDHGPEPEIGGDESGGAKRKVASALGLATAVVSLVAVVRKRRS